MGLFAVGMLISSVHLAATNSTTIESMNRGKVWTLAVLIPRPSDFYASRAPHWPLQFATVSYPGTLAAPEAAGPGQASRHFALLNTRPGQNPFDLGDPLSNMCEVMGYSTVDWFLPLKLSPCANHSRQESMYSLGAVVQGMKRDAGLHEWDLHVRGRAYDQVRRSRSRSRRSTAGSSNAAVRGHSLSETSSQSRSQHRSQCRHRSAHGSGSAARSERTSSQGQAGPR